MSDRQENIITSCTRQQRIKKIIHNDSKTYDVTIEGFFDSNNELMAVTVVKNENGDKVSKVSFKNSYTGQTGKNQNPVPSSPRSKGYYS